MREYLEAMSKSLYMAPKPPAETPIVLAALRQHDAAARGGDDARARIRTSLRSTRAARAGSSALAVARAGADGAARDDAAKARAVARKHLAIYTGLPNYQENLALARLRGRRLARAAAATA